MQRGLLLKRASVATKPKSRSNIKLATGSNDRYAADAFDLVVTNFSNAVIAGASFTENFELIQDKACLDVLCRHYGISRSYKEIFDACYNDWRFAQPKDISRDGFILRTPVMLLRENDVWRDIHLLPGVLLDIVREKMARS